jgi:ATP phosphoribosyltransferase regulatory subunit HisZ
VTEADRHAVAPAQVDRIPSGTRDVLPDEMREVRALTDRMHGVFSRAGYGEVYTPALEYESTFARQTLEQAAPAYRMFDEQGGVLVLRPDMTIPIARLVATRYTHSDPPFRFCYAAYAYRGVRPQRGQSREFLQAGVELIGSPGAAGTAEMLGVLCAALDAAGLRNYRVGLGDSSLYPSLLESEWRRRSRRSDCRVLTRRCCCAWHARVAAPRCSTASRGACTTRSAACARSTGCSIPRWRHA